MPAPATIAEFVELGCKAGLLEKTKAAAYFQQLEQKQASLKTPHQLAQAMIKDGLLTSFQAQQLLLGRWNGFILSKKYRLLECIGSGGMGKVYLCEHLRMHRLVAIKILPTAQAKDAGNLERFYREARAVAALDHPNIIRAHDIDQDKNLHYLVMEYVEGNTLQHIVKKHGALGVYRVAHYIAQAADGLQHAHQAGLVHRDIKPANLLLDRSGTVKILDLGLARFFHEGGEELTAKHDANAVLGTADYLAPEQAMSSHDVDIRADIYSLGATFYFLLAGHPPFHDKTVPQKLICHQMKQPPAIQSQRPDVPDALSAVMDRMMAKKPEDRFQQPQEIVQALSPWLQTPIGPPPEQEMPPVSMRKGVERTITQDSSGFVSGITQISRSPSLPDTPTVVRGQGDISRTIQPDSGAVSGSSNASDSGKPPSSNISGPSTATINLEDTYPFIPELSSTSDQLISEESVFYPQVSRPTSSKRMERVPVSSRTWLLPLVAVLGLVGLVVGGWRLWNLFNSSPPDSGNNNGLIIYTKPENAKLPYLPAPSPLGKLVHTITGLSAPVTSVALSPDGEILITAIKERTSKTWSTITGQFRNNLVGHGKAVSAITFSLDGKSAVSVDWDGVLCLWDPHNGYLLKRYTDSKILKKPLYCVDISPDGDQAICGGEDQLLHLLDLKTGKIIRSLKGHTKAVWAVAFAPDGKRVISGAEDNTVRLWDVQSGKELAQWKDHKGMVKSVAFSPDGRFAASAGQDQQIFLWDTDSNQKRHTFKGHNQTVTAVAFSLDGHYLLSGSEDGTVRVWGILSGQEVFQYPILPQPTTSLSCAQNGTVLAVGHPDQTARLFQAPTFFQRNVPGLAHVFTEHKGAVEAIAVSPDGKRAASAGLDKIIRIWDLENRKELRKIPGHGDVIYSLAFSADGKRLLSSSKDKTIRQWNVDSTKQEQSYQGHTAEVYQALFALTGSRILSASADTTVRLWDVDKNKVTVVKEFKGHTKGVWGLAWSRDGKQIATTGADKTIRLWDTATGMQLKEWTAPSEAKKILFTSKGQLLTNSDQNLVYLWNIPPQGEPVAKPLAGHADKVTSLDLSRDGRYVLSGAKDGEIILWDLDKLRPLYFFQGHKGAVKDIAFLPDNEQAISAGEDGSVRLWNLPPCIANPSGSTEKIFAGHPLEVNHLSLSFDGKKVATACNDNNLRLWEVASGKELALMTGHSQPVRHVQFSPDGKWLLSGSEDQTMRLWKVETGKEIHVFKGHQGPVFATAFSADGKWFLSGSGDKSAILWNGETGDRVKTFAGHEGAVTVVEFSLDGKKVLTASADKTLRMWEVETGKTLQEFKGHTASIKTLAISPNGRLALSGGEDNVVILWDLDQGKLLHRFTGHTKAVESVAFSPDGLQALSGSTDNTLRLWDLTKRQPLASLPGHGGAVTGLTFTPDAWHAISCSQDRTLRLWNLPITQPAQVTWK